MLRLRWTLADSCLIPMAVTTQIMYQAERPSFLCNRSKILLNTFGKEVSGLGVVAGSHKGSRELVDHTDTRSVRLEDKSK
jgi:hypothetical protein